MCTQPPELLARGTLSPSADVFAVGVLMWEIFTAEKVRASRAWLRARGLD